MSTLKKFLLYSLMVLFVTNGTALELFKIPSLVKHYQQHKRQQESINFTDFLAMHYVGNDLNDSDNQQDSQLPFKKSGLVSSFNAEAMITENIPFEFVAVEFTEEAEKQLLRPQVYTSNFSTHVFRPPIY